MTTNAQGGLRLVDGTVDLRRELVHRAGSVTALTTREAELLAYLSQRPGESVARLDLQTQVWGYHPTVLSRAIDTTVRRLRTKIELDPSRPVHLLTVHGVGYRFEPARSTAVSMAPEPAHNGVRAAADPFVGRAAWVAATEAALARWPVVTLVGPAGIGKSRLAHRLARLRVEQGVPVRALRLESVADPATLALAVARRLGVQLPPGDPIAAAGRLLEAAAPALWWLDDADVGVEAVAAAVTTWTGLVPAGRFLVTSRERLKVDGEGLIQVPAMPADEATELFGVRASAVDPTFAPDPDPLARVIEALEGNPLAIELAATRVHLLSLPTLADRLDQPLDVLGAQLRGRPRRRASLRGALDVSWNLLDPSERQALSQLTVFRGGFTTDLAERVLRVDGGAWAGDLIGRLADRSVVETLGAGRFTLSAAVRDHAAERAAPGHDVLDRLVDAMVALGARLVEALDTPQAPGCLDRLGLEAGNLRQALAVVDDPGRHASLTVILDVLLEARGASGERVAALDASLARADGAPPASRADLLARRGDAHRVAGRIAEAARDLRAAGELADASGATALCARVRAHRASLAWMRGALDEAHDHALAARKLAAEVADAPTEARAATVLGGLARRHGALDEADGFLLDALALVRRAGAVRLEALVLHQLAVVRREQGRLAEAADLLAEASAGFRRLGHTRWEAVARHDRGALLAAAGAHVEAESEVRAALERARLGGERIVTAHVLHTLAVLRHRAGCLGEAERLYIDAIELLRGVDPALASSARGDLAALHADRGQIASATRALDEVRSGLEAAEDPAAALVHELHRGHLDVALARASTDPVEASAHLASAHDRLARARAADDVVRDRCRLSEQLLVQTLERVP